MPSILNHFRFHGFLHCSPSWHRDWQVDRAIKPDAWARGGSKQGAGEMKPERLSPGSVARSIKKIATELLTITEPEVSFRERGSKAVGGGFLHDDLGLLDRRLRNGAVDRTDSGH
jgi:hypothetical protein